MFDKEGGGRVPRNKTVKRMSPSHSSSLSWRANVHCRSRPPYVLLNAQHRSSSSSLTNLLGLHVNKSHRMALPFRTTPPRPACRNIAPPQLGITARNKERTSETTKGETYNILCDAARESAWRDRGLLCAFKQNDVLITFYLTTLSEHTRCAFPDSPCCCTRCPNNSYH